jgi:phosphoribosylanthranilate isomerase
MSSRVRVKVCGITRRIDAEAAVDAGADAIGFVFWRESPRAIGVDEAHRVARALPPLVARVGVFVNATPDEVADVVSRVGLDVVQLHGDERVDGFTSVRARLVRAVALTGDDGMRAALALPEHVLPLVDAVDPARRGGTGQRADWTRAADLARQRATILAGGLTPENVAEAIRAVRPWAVDVSSGVETAPGVKSPDRIRQFLAAAAAVRLEGV